MTWEEKLHELRKLGDLSLKMRGPGDWYVEQVGVSISHHDGFLRSEHGNGATPKQAVEDHWRILTSVQAPSEIIRRANPQRYQRAFRWEGGRWVRADKMRTYHVTGTVTQSEEIEARSPGEARQAFLGRARLGHFHASEPYLRLDVDVRPVPLPGEED